MINRAAVALIFSILIGSPSSSWAYFICHGFVKNYFVYVKKNPGEEHFSTMPADGGVLWHKYTKGYALAETIERSMNFRCSDVFESEIVNGHWDQIPRTLALKMEWLEKRATSGHGIEYHPVINYYDVIPGSEKWGEKYHQEIQHYWHTQSTPRYHSPELIQEGYSNIIQICAYHCTEYIDN